MELNFILSALAKFWQGSVLDPSRFSKSNSTASLIRSVIELPETVDAHFLTSPDWVYGGPSGMIKASVG